MRPSTNQSSGCPLQLSAERQNSDAPSHSLLTAICGGRVLHPGVAARILTEKPDVELVSTRAMLRIFVIPEVPCGVMCGV